MDDKQIAVKIDMQSYKKLKERKQKTGITIIHMISEAIEEYLKKHEV